MAEIEWRYDKSVAHDTSLHLSGVMAGQGNAPAHHALRSLGKTNLGSVLVQYAQEKGCRIAVDKELPAYGLMLGGDETYDGNPMVVLSGDDADWQHDFGVFVCGHELTHIYQDGLSILRTPPVFGLHYGAASSMEAGGAVALMAESVLSERMADIIGVYAACQYADVDRGSRILSLLDSVEVLSGLFSTLVREYDGVYDASAVRSAMDADNFTQKEWDYYAAYSDHLPKSFSRSTLSESFNRQVIAQFGRYDKAQREMAHSLLKASVKTLCPA